ncbi:uncharacterized protein GGS22DRAFT_166248 [Annulohypoxylon maeteangense]|uniref:uncharacterized protein n=1 Tax=Annulohypoxylon maeteangense TaxID=1927788 RepID=UPI0020082571|nr:uncharacterized protein GGS22DRAFT_166248 [Annulohypoxylon maeteangense]KAI0883855.1 hypothetical protein GGS22DRAFT_166248 [Annulohypoxylon maeteangense]
MRSLSRSSLFSKKSKNNLQSRKDSIDEQTTQHSRKWSTSSTASQASSTASHDRLYDPLSLHPPLSLNSSPHMISEFDEARDEAEREHRFFRQTQHVEDHLQDSTEYSPIKSRNCYLRRPSEARPYVYDQSGQWPLKDWQAIPPGLAELSSPASSAVVPPQPTNHRRPTNWMHESDAMLKRGDWKRRGIVFHLDEETNQEQEQHFELPEC